jgi:hypothetical protein
LRWLARSVLIEARVVEETQVLERFVALVQRELQAEEVTVLDAPAPDDPRSACAQLSEGKWVLARFAEAPADLPVRLRRLEMLAATFSDALLPSERTRAARPSVAISLHEELRAAAARAQAEDAVVIDAQSPVVWGCASSPVSPRAYRRPQLRDVGTSSAAANDSPPRDEAHDEAPTSSNQEHSPPAPEVSGQLPHAQDGSGPLPHAQESSELLREHDGPSVQRPSRPVAAAPDRTARAIVHVRGLEAAAGLARGRHLRHVERDDEYYLALSFSGIYVLIFVFDGPFDELRAERAAHESLARVEGLVAALPPLDPEPQPMGGVVALRRPRRR